MSPYRKLKKNFEARVLPFSILMLLIATTLTVLVVITPTENNAVLASTVGNTDTGNDSAYITLQDYNFAMGIWFEAPEDGTVDNISAHFDQVDGTFDYQCALYEFVDYGTNWAGALINTTNVVEVANTEDNTWQVFPFNVSEKPSIVSGTKYYIMIRPCGYTTSINKLDTSNNVEGYAFYYQDTEGDDPPTFDDPYTSESGSTSAYYCLYASYSTDSNTAPTITGENPSNESTDEELTPTCNATVTDADGDAMTVTFASNYSSSWVNYQTTTSCSNGSYSWEHVGATTGDTTYYWRVYCDDGTSNISKTYHFTTLDIGSYDIDFTNNTNDKFTWTGEAGDTVWANSSGSYYETLIIYTNLSGVSDVYCTNISIDFTDFDSDIVQENLSIEFSNSSDGVWNGTTYTVPAADGNVTINSTVWTESGWCHGTDPFNITGYDSEIHVRVKVEIPSGISTGTKSNSAAWKVLWKIEY